MRTRHMTTSAMIACLLLAGGQALAQPQLPEFRPGDVIRAGDLNRIVEQIRRNTSALDGVGGAVHTVDCGAGETIANAMSQTRPGATITISGTCEEAVVVTKDGITLDGGGAAVIDGGDAAPAIAVHGQRNIVIRGLTVQNGQQGVLADRGAAVWLEDVTAQNNATGIAIRGNSSATFGGTVIANDNDLGIELTQSTIWSEDAALLQTNGNPNGGISVHRGSQMALAGARKIEVTGNGVYAVTCYLDSSLSVISTHGAATDFQVSNNDGAGIWVGNGAHLVLEGVDLTVTDNQWFGLEVTDSSSIATFGGYSFADLTVPTGSAAFDNNGGSGVSIDKGSTASLQDGAITFNNNGGSGISVFEGSTATLSGTISGTINGNQGYAGLWVTQGSSVVAFNLTVENNAQRGIGVFRHSFLDLYNSLVTSGHDHSGIRVYTSKAILDGVTSTGNAGDGISVSSDSHLRLRGDSSVTNNGGSGIRAAPMGVSVDISDSVITGNAIDIEAGKGTHIGWVNTAVGTIECDDNVLTFDEAACLE